MRELLKATPPVGSATELRARLADIYPGEEIRLPARLDAVLALHQGLDDQRPATCPAYALSYLLPARGLAELNGNPLTDEDFMAHLAAVTIEAGEDAASYRFPVESSEDPAQVGASPEGVTRAVALASKGELVSVPVPGRRSDGAEQLTPTAWEALLDVAEPGFLEGDVDILFNYESDQLLGARHPAYTAANLRRADAAEVIPRDDWGVGHYAPLGGLWRRPSGERWLVLLNSFKGRAFAGIEPQPAELVRRGVVRGDGRAGGVLLIAGRERGGELLHRLARAGLEVAIWNNGSRPPSDWAWRPGL